MSASPARDYPVVFDVAYPEDPGRFSILIRWILAIPHFIVTNLLTDVAAILAFFAFWVILFTGRFPESLFRFIVGAYRWQYNVTIYTFAHPRPYPPFSFDDGVYPHLSFDVQRAERYANLLPLIKWLLLVPHYIVLALLSLVAVFVGIITVIAIVVTGRFPRWAFDYLVGVQRWTARVTAYFLLQVDAYPPFSLR